MAAVLIFEAIDTASAILNAIYVWIVVGAFVLTVVVFTFIVTVAHGWKVARRRVARRSWARGPIRARIYARSRRKRSSGRTADPEYQEAA